MEKLLQFSLTETSEKTTEINTLSDLTILIENLSGRRVTIVSPTARDERKLSFDEIVEGLAPGRLLAFQFKRPLAMRRPKCVKFVVDTNQMQTLLGNFLPRQAYYVFVPYPLNRDMMRNRRNILRDAIGVDVYNIPNARKISKRSRTVRYCSVGSSSNLMITDPRTYQTIETGESLESLAKKFSGRQIGMRLPLTEKRKKAIERKRQPRKMFYLHLALE